MGVQYRKVLLLSAAQGVERICLSGFEIVHAWTYTSALRILKNEIIDILVSPLRTPVSEGICTDPIHGINFLRFLAGRFPALEMMLLESQGDDRFRELLKTFKGLRREKRERFLEDPISVLEERFPSRELIENVSIDPSERLVVGESKQLDLRLDLLEFFRYKSRELAEILGVSEMGRLDIYADSKNYSLCNSAHGLRFIGLLSQKDGHLS